MAYGLEYDFQGASPTIIFIFPTLISLSAGYSGVRVMQLKNPTEQIVHRQFL